MKSSRKRAKLVEDRSSNCHSDKISNLPDELLVQILSSLPTSIAVRSSILSRRWRYLFKLTDCLAFDDACFKRPRRKTRFKKFVYKVMKLHQNSPIRKFRLVCRGNYNKSHLNAWVNFAGQKGVQELYYAADEYGLPDAFAMCKTLVKLKVIGYTYHVAKFSLSSGLPNLKILHLKYVRFDGNHETERLLSNCEFLEELTLDNCELYAKGHVTIYLGLLKVLRINQCYVTNGILEIEAPNLAYLTYYSTVGVKIVPSWKTSCSLVEAKLHFNCRSDDYRSFENDRDILRDVAYKTIELHLLSDSVQCLVMMDDKRQVPVFPSLSRLHLSSLSYNSLKSMTSMLDKSPRLEKVVFGTSFRRCCCDFEVVSVPSGESLIPFSCHVKVIEVHDFCGHEGPSLLLGHLLRNARVLKKLIVHKCYDRDGGKAEELQISKKLLMLPRASSDCCIKLK